MDTRDDAAIYAIEKKIIANRSSAPCGGYDEVSRSISLCDFCGFDEAAHLDRAHALALDEDLERAA